MLVIGITGGIGTGKSEVTRIFRELGAVTFSADDSAREVLAPGTDGLREVTEAFGPEVVGPDGWLNRNRLSEIVFADSEARKRLESISHPRILRKLEQQIESAKGESAGGIIAVEVPLLYEAGMQDWFDRIIVVTAPESTQLARLRERSKMNESDARARIRSQMPLAEKAERADIVIENGGTLQELRKAVLQVWSELKTEGG